MSPLDNVTALVTVIACAAVVLAFGLGYFIGKSDGLELRLRRTLRLARRRR